MESHKRLSISELQSVGVEFTAKRLSSLLHGGDLWYKGGGVAQGAVCPAECVGLCVVATVCCRGERCPQGRRGPPQMEARVDLQWGEVSAGVCGACGNWGARPRPLPCGELLCGAAGAAGSPATVGWDGC